MSGIVKGCWRSNCLRFLFVFILTAFIAIGCGGSDDPAPVDHDTPKETIDNSKFYGVYNFHLKIGNCLEEDSTMTIGNDRSRWDEDDYLYIPQLTNSDLIVNDGNEYDYEITVSGNTVTFYEEDFAGQYTWKLVLTFSADYKTVQLSGLGTETDPTECDGDITGSATRVTTEDDDSTVQWNALTDNPVLQGAGGEEYDDCMVLKDDESYKMWFQVENNDSIFYATSNDGIVWTEHPGPVLEPGPAGSWDEIEADGPMVIKESGLYKMWYSSDGSPAQIGYATSPDGINWTKYEGNPLLEGFIPTVVKDGATYRMWYCKDESGNDNESIFYAVSDDGIEWTIQNGGNPVLTYAGAGFVIKNNSIYEIWYEDNQKNGISYATSTNGITWNTFAGNPVIPSAGDPTVIKDGDQYKMWCVTSQEDGIYYTSTIE